MVSSLVEPQVAPAVPARLVPQLEAITLTDQHSRAARAPRIRAAPAAPDPSVPVELQVGGMTHHEPLELPRLRVQARQAHQLAFDLLPVGQGIEKEALVTVDGDDQLALAALA